MTKQIVLRNTENSNELYTVLPVFKKGIANVGSKIYNNPTLEDLENEIWIDALGFDGIYEVSNLGRIKSLGRYVPNGKSERWVKEKIRKQVLCPDGRLTCPLSHNNIRTSINVSAFIFYSFNPNLQNDNLNDEVYHINKIQNDNRLCNLSYNKIKGKSYKISIELGNVKHLDEARKKHHKYTKGTAIIKNKRTTHRKCKRCGNLKEQKCFEIYGRNTCTSCREIQKKETYLKNTKGKVSKRNNKDVYITDTVTKEVSISTNKNKCIVSKQLINRYANTGELVYPYKNSKHKNPLLIQIKERNSEPPE